MKAINPIFGVVNVVKGLMCCGGDGNGFECSECPYNRYMNTAKGCKTELHERALQYFNQSIKQDAELHSLTVESSKAVAAAVVNLLDHGAPEIQITQNAGQINLDWLMK